MTTIPESVLEQARAIWPISWSVENGDLRGVYDPANLEVTFTPLPSGPWQVFWFEWLSPIEITADQVLKAIRVLRDAWWKVHSQQEGAISDLERQVLATVNFCGCGGDELTCTACQPAPVVWLRLQQIKQREADKHRMMVRVERNRIRKVGLLVYSEDAEDDPGAAIIQLRDMLPEFKEIAQ